MNLEQESEKADVCRKKLLIIPNNFPCWIPIFTMQTDEFSNPDSC